MTAKAPSLRSLLGALTPERRAFYLAQPAVRARVGPKRTRVRRDRDPPAWAGDHAVTLAIPGLRLLRKHGLNGRMHWAPRHREVKAIAATVRTMLSVHRPPAGPWEVVLTRHGPRMDDDNMAGVFKAIRDEIAKWLGVDDGNRRWVTWRYEGVESTQFGVAVRVAPVRAMAGAKDLAADAATTEG